MKPLSVFLFLRGSIKKILPVTITVCLGVAILYFMSMFTRQLDSQLYEVELYPSKNMSIVYGGGKGVSQEDLDELKEQAGSSSVISASFRYVNYNAIVGSTTTSLLMINKEDTKTLMDDLGLKLSSGRLPENPMELMLHRKLAANRGVKIGDTVSNNQKGWHVNEDIKVVGFFEGESVIGIGTGNEEALRPGMPGASVIVCGDRESLSGASNYIDKNLGNKYQITTYNTALSMIKRFKAPMDTMKLFIGMVLIVVIGIFLTNITTIQYTLRKKELELLHAIGYTRRYIVMKGLGEIGIASLMGYILGIVLSVSIGWVINIYYLADRGLAMPLFSTGSMLIMLLVPITISLFALIAPIKLTRFRDIT